MGLEPPSDVRHPGLALAWAVGFAVIVDVVTDGPPGIGIPIAAWSAAIGILAVGRPGPSAIPFLLAGSSLSAFVAVRASPVLAAMDVVTATGLFALAASFAREGEPLRTGLRSFAVRAFAWTASIRSGLGVIARPLNRLPAARRLPRALPRPFLISVSVGLAFAFLLGSADAVFAELLRSPFENLPFDRLPGHAAIVAASALAFTTIATRASTPVGASTADRRMSGGGLRPPDWISVLVTVDALFAGFVAVQFATMFGGREYLLSQAGLTYAEYARSGFWHLLAAACLTGLVLAGAWIGGRPQPGRQRLWFGVLACLLIGLSLVVLASAFRRLVLYEGAFGFTWPRLLGHAATLLIGALLACGLLAVLVRRTTWLPAAGLTLAFLTLVGLNLMDAEAFIAERNLARAAAGHEIDVRELASLSADAIPAIARAMPGLDRPTRRMLEGVLACERAALQRDVARYGWASFNVARDAALERSNVLALPDC